MRWFTAGFYLGLTVLAGCGDFEMPPPPTLSEVVPPTWTADQAPLIVINGENLSASSDDDDARFVVTVGGLEVEDVRQLSNEQLTGTAPLGMPPGEHDLEVTTPAGQTAVLEAAVTVMSPLCEDGVQNDDESDIDCGGATCDRCTGGQTCDAATDCDSGLCLDGGCPTQVACDESIETCPGMFASCDLGGRYVLADFPADSPLQFVVTASATDIIEISMALVDPVTPGTNTALVWYEPGCAAMHRWESMGANIFGLASDGIFVREHQIFESGDHFVEIETDMQATVAVGVRSYAL